MSETKQNVKEIQDELAKLTVEYKTLFQKREGLIKDLNKITEDICKKTGAIQALQDLLRKIVEGDSKKKDQK